MCIFVQMCTCEMSTQIFQPRKLFFSINHSGFSFGQSRFYTKSSHWNNGTIKGIENEKGGQNTRVWRDNGDLKWEERTEKKKNENFVEGTDDRQRQKHHSYVCIKIQREHEHIVRQSGMKC